MLSKEIKNKILKENDINKALNILKKYESDSSDEEAILDEEVIQHLTNITPGTMPIEDFGYMRKNTK